MYVCTCNFVSSVTSIPSTLFIREGLKIKGEFVLKYVSCGIFVGMLVYFLHYGFSTNTIPSSSLTVVVVLTCTHFYFVFFCLQSLQLARKKEDDEEEKRVGWT